MIGSVYYIIYKQIILSLDFLLPCLPNYYAVFGILLVYIIFELMLISCFFLRSRVNQITNILLDTCISMWFAISKYYLIFSSSSLYVWDDYHEFRNKIIRIRISGFLVDGLTKKYIIGLFFTLEVVFLWRKQLLSWL